MRAFVAVLLIILSSGSNAAELARPSFSIVSRDLGEGRRIVAVRLSGRADEAELIAIAQGIVDQAPLPGVRTLVTFYLPKMGLDSGAWANVSFVPEAKATIMGLRRDEVQTYATDVAADRRALLGSWLTDLPAPPGRITIFSDRGKAFVEWRLRSGRTSVDEVSQTRGTRGSRFDARDRSADYYLVKLSGELELRNKDQLIAVAERVVPPKPQVVAKGAGGAVSSGKSAAGASGQNSISAMAAIPDVVSAHAAVPARFVATADASTGSLKTPADAIDRGTGQPAAGSTPRNRSSRHVRGLERSATASGGISFMNAMGVR